MTDTRITQFVNGPVVGTTRFTRANADNGLAHDLHTVEIGAGITLLFSAAGLDQFITDLSVAQSRLLTAARTQATVKSAALIAGERAELPLCGCGARGDHDETHEVI